MGLVLQIAPRVKKIALGHVIEAGKAKAMLHILPQRLFIKPLEARGIEDQRVQFGLFVMGEGALEFVDILRNRAAAGGGEQGRKAQTLNETSGGSAVVMPRVSARSISRASVMIFSSPVVHDTARKKRDPRRSLKSIFVM